MPTRKQRKRQQKLRRHEWEEVYVDAEGRELAPDEVEEIAPAKGRPRAAKADARKRAPAQQNRIRPVKPPSWRRVGKRALIFAPLMYLVISLLPGSRDLELVERLIQTAYLILIFVPFSYLMDSMTYRLWKRRTAEAGGDGSKR